MLTVFEAADGLSLEAIRSFDTTPAAVCTGASRRSMELTAGHSTCVFSMYSMGSPAPDHSG